MFPSVNLLEYHHDRLFNILRLQVIKEAYRTFHIAANYLLPTNRRQINQTKEALPKPPEYSQFIIPYPSVDVRSI